MQFIAHSHSTIIFQLIAHIFTEQWILPIIVIGS